jgi:hypothetical protein
MGITILVNNSQVKKRLFVSFGQAMPMTDGGCKQTQCTLADRVFVGDGDYWVAGTDVKSAPTGALLDGAAVAGHAVIIERLDVVALREVPDGKQYRRITGAFRRDLGGKAAQFLGRGIMKRPEIGSSIETDDSSNGVSEFRGNGWPGERSVIGVTQDFAVGGDIEGVEADREGPLHGFRRARDVEGGGGKLSVEQVKRS